MKSERKQRMEDNKNNTSEKSRPEIKQKMPEHHSKEVTQRTLCDSDPQMWPKSMTWHSARLYFHLWVIVNSQLLHGWEITLQFLINTFYLSFKSFYKAWTSRKRQDKAYRGSFRDDGPWNIHVSADINPKAWNIGKLANQQEEHESEASSDQQMS